MWIEVSDLSKLKRLTEEDHFRKFHDDPYHCCRWCHWSKVEDPFDGRKCFYHHNPTVEVEGNIQDVYKVAEDGLLSQALEEVLNEEPLVNKLMLKVEHILDKWNISQKRKQEFEKHFIEVWGEFADFDLKEKLDDKVSVLYQTKVEEFGNESEGIPVSDDFCCKYFE